MIGFVYEFIYTAICAVICISASAPYLGMGEAFLWLTLAGVMVMGGMVAFKNLGWSVRFIMIGVVVAIGLAVLLLSRNEAVGELIGTHLYVLWIAVPVIASFVLGELCARFELIRIISALAAVGGCVAAVALEYQPEHTTVVGVLALVLTVLTEMLQIRWNKDGYTDHKGHLVYVSPFLLCAMISVSLISAPDEAYDWHFVKELYRMAYDKVQEISELFDIKGAYDPAAANIGFSGRGVIHDAVKDGSGEMLTIYDVPIGMTSVKLAGRTFDAFDGYEWTDSDVSDAPDAMLDTLSLLASVRDYSDQPQDYVKKASLRIRYSGINTSYVFMPLKPLTGGRDIAEAGMTYAGGDMMWPDIRSYKTEYTIPFYRINTDNRLFEDYLRNCEIPARDNFELESRMFSPAGREPYTYEDLMAHIDHVEKTYSAPVQLSDEVSSLMDEVYDGAEDTYDRMRRLENYLRSLKYTDSPGPLPDGMQVAGDFLDYFLLESKSGYCTHYATAFVLLARAEGIPARYVQGYIADTSSSGPVSVDSSMAHAWPEVYYEGAGWIPYEPTPLYHVRSYWRSAEETRAMYEEAAGAYPGEEEEQEADAGIAAEEETGDSGISIPWYAIVIPPVAGISLTLIFIIIGNLITVCAFRRKGDEDRFETLCRQDMSLLRLMECELGSAETLNEYSRRLQEDLEYKHLGFIQYYGEYLYRGNTDMKKALEAAYVSRTDLLKKLKKLYPLRFLRYYMGFQRGA